MINIALIKKTEINKLTNAFKEICPVTICMTCDTRLLPAVRNATYREKWHQYGQDIQQTEALLLQCIPT